MHGRDREETQRDFRPAPSKSDQFPSKGIWARSDGAGIGPSGARFYCGPAGKTASVCSCGKCRVAAGPRADEGAPGSVTTAGHGSMEGAVMALAQPLQSAPIFAD